MTRHVVTSSQVFHLWAHQAQSDARNGTGSVFFEGATVYSYRRGWPLATIHKRRKGVLVLTNSDRYSVTTSQHQNDANRAASHLQQIAVPYPTLDAGANSHEGNLKHFADEMAAALARAGRKLKTYAINYELDTARRFHAQFAEYAKFFGIRRKLKFPEDLATAAAERSKRINDPDPVRDAARFRARQKREERKRAALQQDYDTYTAAVAVYNAQNPEQFWRDTGGYPPAPYLSWKLSRKLRNAGFVLPERVDGYGYNERVLLRVHHDEIVTSKGARIPLSHAARLWRLIASVRASGRPYIRNGHTEHAGAFAVDRIDADGTLTAGCHTIMYDELRRLAVSLYLAPVAETVQS
jgi:hypothetical protein